MFTKKCVEWSKGLGDLLKIVAKEEGNDFMLKNFGKDWVVEFMNKFKENTMHVVFLAAACISILAVALICIFLFANGIPGSGSWCFVAHESAKEDRIEIIGNKGQICFSVFTYQPIALHTEKGREEIIIENPPHVQLPLIKQVVEHLQQKGICKCDSVSATSVNWVVDRILGKL